jgi:ATP-dependent DNA helicase RecG
MGSAPEDGLESAVRALEALVPPLRFAVRDGFAGAERLTGLGATVRGAVERARSFGAADSPALRRLLAEAEAFDRAEPAERRRAVARMAAQLGALIPLPPELREAARAARLEPRPGAAAPPAPTARPGPSGAGAPVPSAARPMAVDARAHAPGREEPERESSPVPAPPEPRTPTQREERRRALRRRLADLPRAHPAPRAQLEERGRETVEAALEFWPKAYQDRTAVRRIRELSLGEEGNVLVRVVASRAQRMRNGRPLLKVTVVDAAEVAGGAAARLELVFFNPPPWRLKGFAEGDTLFASGKVSEGFGGRRQLSQPEVEKVQPGDSANFGRIVPFYVGPADYQHPTLRKLMKRLCDELAPLALDELPPEIRTRRGLLGRGEALQQVHFPPTGTDPELAGARASPAFRRLIFEELFFLQLVLARRRQGVRAEPGIAFDASPAAVARAIERLPFGLTRAQERVLAEIARDMGRPEPMNRLLQGDVGSGKTAVAFAAAMLAVGSGWQAAIMVPTEILAEQHARTLSGWLKGTGIEVARVVAAARGKEQREARAAVADGRARIAVGTHALLEEGVAFDKLGLVVVDEQHRFGVLQRATLMAKGRRPDVLVMTATPIPRTLALAFYGDLDHSKIDELPPGRTQVATRLFGDSQRKAAYEAVRRELERGHQAYVVYPLVEESEKTDLADATSGAEALARTFAGHPVGLLHGRMRAEEKREVMDRFRSGRIQVLVATTVIEVGVDVPNASVMVVEHAERFGLSQLHQLRGRVGRGAAKSHCLLIAHFRRAGDDARERLRAMEQTQDGFELARVDLRIRGPGELVGTRQSGQRLLEVADLYRDDAILEEAREEALALVLADPDLSRPGHEAAREALQQRWAGRLSLAQVG